MGRMRYRETTGARTLVRNPKRYFYASSVLRTYSQRLRLLNRPADFGNCIRVLPGRPPLSWCDAENGPGVDFLSLSSRGTGSIDFHRDPFLGLTRKPLPVKNR